MDGWTDGQSGNYMLPPLLSITKHGAGVYLTMSLTMLSNTPGLYVLL